MTYQLLIAWLMLVLIGSPTVYAAGPVQATTAAPTLTEGSANSVSSDLAGNIRITPGTLAGGEHIGGTEEEGYQRVQPRAGTVGGASYSSRISAGSTEDEHAVCTAACTLYSISATNVNAAVRYLKCFDNVAASTTPGTSTPILRMAIPGAATGGGFSITYPVGVSFTTGLTCWIVTGAADSDVAEVAANELMINYSYKQ